MMNYSLTAILTATVMFAAIFALMPVDDAQAVHTTIQGTQMTQAINTVVADITVNAAAAIVCDSDAAMIIYVTSSGVTADNDAITISDGATIITFEGDLPATGVAGAAGWGSDGVSAQIAATGDETITVDGTSTGAIEVMVSMITTSGATADCV